MRIRNKGGSTPCDRRLDRRKVAMAAAAAVLFFATTARAGFIELAIVPGSPTGVGGSQLSLTVKAADPALPGGPATFGKVTTYPTADADGSSINGQAWGRVYMNYTPGVSLAMDPSSRINFFDVSLYLPGRDGGGNLVTSLAPASAQLGQFGQEITHPFAGLLGYGRIFDMWQTFGTLDAGTGMTTPNGGTPLTNVGGNNYAAIPGPDPDGGGPSGAQVQATLAMAGWNDIVSGILVDQVQLNELAPGDTPFPTPYAGNVATFDGVTLTIPMVSSFSFVDGTTTYTITTSGQIVAVIVPEPSTMVLLGFSVVGLLSYAWRARNRKAA